MQLDVARFIDTVDITESGSDGEVGGNGRERGVNFVDVFRLCV